MERLHNIERNFAMAIIGSFTKQDATYQGALATLTLKSKASFRPVEKTSDKSPDFRIFAGNIEIGAAWSSTSKDNHPYLSVKLDDPSFSAAILARLVEMDNGYSLVWNR
jgi:uncharacterized protein (DUF736 family)